jgi:hypothetical protein
MRHAYSAGQWLALALTAVLLCTFWVSHVTDSPVVWDAGENLVMMLNVERHGVMSLSNDPPYSPSMYREPLPIYLGSLGIRAVDAMLGETDNTFYFRGERARLLKLIQNTSWLTVLSILTYALARALDLGFWPALGCVLVQNCLLLKEDTGYFMIDSLYSESIASALLTLASLLLLTGIRRESMIRIGMAGAAFGALALVKTTFLYMALMMLVAMPVLAFMTRRPVRLALRQAGVLAAATMLVASPWMVRNYHDFGYFSIALRGGETLYVRAVCDQMTRDEYVGAYYYYAPWPLSGLLRRALGFPRDALDEGGRLQRLNQGSWTKFYMRDYLGAIAGRPEDTVTYMNRAEADRFKAIDQLAAAGDPYPEVTVDRALQPLAFRMIREHPLRHIAQIPLNLWEGAFLCFPVLLVVLISAIRRGRLDIAATLTPAIGSLVFCATFAHLEPRYPVPTYSLAVCTLMALALSLRRRTPGQAAPPASS